MKKKTSVVLGTIVGAALAIGVFLGLAAISWIITCGIIKLITVCFGWTFSWAWATGIWLVMFLLRATFNHTTNVEK